MADSPDLYYTPMSAPCRAVLLTAKALDFDLNLIPIDLEKGEHLTPEYLKINPQQTVPTLVDNGFNIWESRAIIHYLARKYDYQGVNLLHGSEYSNYQVDQVLYFNDGTLYKCWKDYFYPQLYEGAPPNKVKFEKVHDALKIVNNKLLRERSFLVAGRLTIADLDYIATISTFEASDIDFLQYPNIRRWYDNIKDCAPGYEEANEKGLAMFKEYVNSKMKKI